MRDLLDRRLQEDGVLEEEVNRPERNGAGHKIEIRTQPQCQRHPQREEQRDHRPDRRAARPGVHAALEPAAHRDVEAVHRVVAAAVGANVLDAGQPLLQEPQERRADLALFDPSADRDRAHANDDSQGEGDEERQR